MDSYECKIKKVLAENKQDYSEHFAEFLLDEQNLAQLSKLFLQLKTSADCTKSHVAILEPTALVTEHLPITTSESVDHVAIDSQIEKDSEIAIHTEIKQNSENVTPNCHEDSALSDTHYSLKDSVDSNTDKIAQTESVKEVQHLTDSATQDIQQQNPLEEADQVSEQSTPIASIEIVSEPQTTLTSSADEILIATTSPEEAALSAEAEKNRQEIESVFRRSKYEDIKFQVENARVGQSYQSKIIVISHHDANEIQFKADSFHFPDDTFSFDEASQTIQAEPQQAHEFEFTFQFYVDKETRSARCRLNVIADPRSLWKVLEPEAGQAFMKSHTDQAIIDTAEYKIVAASRRGRSHEHAGTFRDDDFSITQIEQSNWSVLCVADGAGSATYSREGSRIAAEIVQSEFQRYLTASTIADLNQDLRQWQVGSQDAETNAIAAKLNQQFHLVYYEIYKSIIEQIELQANQMAVQPKLFSTTLLVAVIAKLADKTFMCTFSVGDGAIAVYSENSIRLMNVPDGGEYAGQTKFLDRSIAQEFASRLKIGCFEDTQAILLMTDGISDPVFETDSGLANFDKWQKLYAELNPILQAETAEHALLEWMHFFTPGHHDDRTMAVLWNKA